MAEFDLTVRNGEMLDKHMILAQLEFIYNTHIYDDKCVLELLLEKANDTDMVDYVMDMRKRLEYGDKIPDSLVARRSKIVSNLRKLRNIVSPVTAGTRDLYSSENIRNAAVVGKDMIKKYNIQPEQLLNAILLARQLYECGNYSEAGEYLFFLLNVMPPSDEHYAALLWGKLAAEMLMKQWGTAVEDFERLHHYIETRELTMAKALQNRSWLLQWSVVLFFNHAQGRGMAIDLYLYEPDNLKIIKTTSPHLLRYLTVAVILTPYRRTALRDLIRLIGEQLTIYSDPVTQFVQKLCVDYDFAGAHDALKLCKTVFGNDFYLWHHFEEFVEQGRLLIFETFCRIHQHISIALISCWLALVPRQAEEWVKELINNARRHAAIVSPASGYFSIPYNELLDRISVFTTRTQQLEDLIAMQARVRKDAPKRL